MSVAKNHLRSMLEGLIDFSVKTSPEAETRVANGRPFSMLGDLKSLALDVILTFHFGDDF